MLEMFLNKDAFLALEDTSRCYTHVKFFQGNPDLLCELDMEKSVEDSFIDTADIEWHFVLGRSIAMSTTLSSLGLLQLSSSPVAIQK
jgi:hypothetical protein